MMTSAAGAELEVVKVGVITYAFPHLKTEQLVHNLMRQAARGADNICYRIALLALPFVQRKEREVLIPHRPTQSEAASTKELAAANRLEYLECSYDNIPGQYEYYLVGGAGIIPAHAIGNKKIINAHPGIIPAARGLDAFKWSIFNMVPLGVTLHYIDRDVDKGERIAMVRTPVYAGDSLAVLARRHYELEVDMMSNFVSYIRNPVRLDDLPGERPSRMRMPTDIERQTISRFDQYVDTFRIR
jgi:phosphoribosylglycinamide formyltransferase-1